MPPSAPKSALRRLFEDRLLQLASDVEGIVAGDIEKARREFAEQLNQAARRLRQSADTEELAATLADAASGFAAGAAFFRLESEFARGERIRGVGEEAAERFVGLRIPLTSAAALAGAVESKDPVTAAATPTEVSAEWIAIAGAPPDARVSIFPLLIRDEARALLMVWGAAQFAAVELVCQVGAAVWASLEAAKPAAVAADLIQIEGAAPAAPSEPTWESLPAEERRTHLKAQRFARVNVAEMRLRQGPAVLAGRARRDLYGALREEIDQAREKFREAFFVTCPNMVDYLHLEIVRTLANEDADLLGREYPGPLV